MPVWGANGFSIALCSPEQGARVEIDRSDPAFETLRMIEQAKRAANGDIPKEHKSDGETRPCAFSGIYNGAGMLPDVAYYIPPAPAQTRHRNFTNNNIAIEHRQHLPPATGPPYHL